MSLEEFTPDIESQEWSWNSSEKGKEVSEKFKEQIRKAWSWIQRTRKDEKKAKKSDMILANFLVKMIINKKFDNILSKLFLLLDKWYPSNFLLWIVSLIYIDISNKIRESNSITLIEFDYKSEEKVAFDDKNIDDKIKNRINSWIEDIISCVSVDYSHLLNKRLIELLDMKDESILNFTSSVFSFFLESINVSIDKGESFNISEFIVKEILKKIKDLEIEEI